MVGGSTEEEWAWLVRVGIDIRRAVIFFLAVMPVTIPVLLIALIACIDIVLIAEVTIASAIEESAIVLDLHALACTTAEEVIYPTIVSVYLGLALLAHLFAKNLVELWHR
jgi:hypothetical protein